MVQFPRFIFEPIWNLYLLLVSTVVLQKSEKSSKVVSSSEAAADKPSGAAVDTLSG